jgi:hypothetical protein
MKARLIARAGMAVGLLVAIGVVAPLDIAGAPQEDARDARRVGRRTVFFAQLDGGKEVPSVFTTGRGTAIFRIDDEGRTIDYALTYRALEGATTTAAHVHFAQPDVNGGISFFLCGGTTTPPCTPTSGNITGTAGVADILGPEGQGIAPTEFAEVAAAIRSGLAYVNVHTDKHPGGEIRAQLR